MMKLSEMTVLQRPLFAKLMEFYSKGGESH